MVYAPAAEGEASLARWEGTRSAGDNIPPSWVARKRSATGYPTRFTQEKEKISGLGRTTPVHYDGCWLELPYIGLLGYTYDIHLSKNVPIILIFTIRPVHVIVMRCRMHRLAKDNARRER